MRHLLQTRLPKLAGLSNTYVAVLNTKLAAREFVSDKSIEKNES